jgi:hypothetical protein
MIYQFESPKENSFGPWVGDQMITPLLATLVFNRLGSTQ